MKILDNVNAIVRDDLQQTIHKGSKLSIAAACFSIYAYQELKKQLRQIDHKGYKAYKVLEGEYDFGAYRLCIDHVQGDPFATPCVCVLCIKMRYR